MGDSRPSNTCLNKWDVVSYLKSDADMAHYLNACLDIGDLALIAAALGDIARARGLVRVAGETALTREDLDRALSGEGDPEFATLMRIIKALGLKLHAKQL